MRSSPFDYDSSAITADGEALNAYLDPNWVI